MTRLTKQQEELCRTGAIPNGRRDRFVQVVERCVSYYRHSHERKSALAVGEELGHIEKCIWRALGLLDRKTWRPGEFRTTLEDISARLRNLSPAAEEYLQFRNLKIRHDVILSAWTDSIDDGGLIDPICFTNRDDQVLALRDLLGAFDAPVARKKGPGRPLARKKGPGRPPKALERALYHFLAAAYSRDTGRAASDSSTRFVAVCSEIKRIYQLNDWNPESLARSARGLRTRDR
jgi:hypothetical protein